MGLDCFGGKGTSAGRFYPLGCTLTGEGANFSLYSRHGSEVYLLLFDEADGEPTDVIRVENRTRDIWHVFVHGVRAGQLYGYKVFGSYDPRAGHRFNRNKLLMDPYARALTGKFENRHNLLLGYDPESPAADLSFDNRDNTAIVPKSIVVDERFDWEGDRAPAIPLEKLLIYELHVKGFTAHSSSAVSSPGTYLGFIEKIEYLKSLGVNAVELLPVHEFVVDDFLRERGLTNYWGYNTIGFFAPESSYGTGAYPGCQVSEFKRLVRELHRAGIEVILDVVFNHTGEGSERGGTFCFRGIDNATYYNLTGAPHEPGRYYMNYTGCGNSLNFENPQVIRLVMDSLRYWVEAMHVDGFRFDLASVLGREGGAYRTTAGMFAAIAQDPVLSRIKLIAEPWDIGSYDVGNFPVDWSEWNGRFRDTVRRFVKGDSGQVREMGWRVTGSADLYGDDGRSAYNSINFVTCHDGFTLYDLVAYNHKHNEANGEDNRDGASDNNAWNCGAEGDTDDPEVMRLRKQQVKNFLCALLLSSGTPMILGGDEFMRTQRGNNNAYCQDNATSWFDWRQVRMHGDMVEFFRKVVGLVRAYPILQRRKFLLGFDLDADNVPDITWFGKDLSAPAWNDPDLRTLAFRLDGGEAGEEKGGGNYQLFIIMNADFNFQTVLVPEPPGRMHWFRILDTSLEQGDDILEKGDEVPLSPTDYYIVNPRSTVVLVAR